MMEKPAIAESNGPKILGFLVAAIALLFALQTIYATGFGLFYPIEQRAGVYVASVLIVVLSGIIQLSSDTEKSSLAKFQILLDIVMLVGLVWSIQRYMMVMTVMAEDIYEIETVDTIAAFIGIIVFLEITRRVWGRTLFICCLICLAYILIGKDLPGFLAHSGFSLDQVAENLWFNLNKGVFGTITNIVINIVLIFVLFGVLLETTGAGETLIKYAFRVTKRTRGGPAHAAIVASSLFGTMSGSPVANIVGTGTFTIPMIKKRGFSPAFAAGIEATASCGGQIMPPIMGAAALVMADLAGIPYLFVIAAALLPAIFYYISLFFSVTVEARKQGIEPEIDESLMVITKQDRMNAIMFATAIGAVVISLVLGFSPAMAGFFALCTLVVTSVVNPLIRKDPSLLVKGLIKGAINCAELMISVAAIEIIVGVLDTTGVGLKFASLVEHLGAGSLFLSLLVAMAGALVLGMGMPTLPAYLIIVLIMGPSIKLLGLSTLVVHLFVFYYGVASSLTPPVAIAAFVAAPIAGANPFVTALMALRIGAVKFIIPFVFAYYPTLLLVEQFDLVTFLSIVPRLLMAIYLISSALSAFDRVRLDWISLGLRLVVAIALLLTSWQIHWAAFLVGAIILYHHWKVAPDKETAALA
tara:strand:+ start:936 stop:2858 length:1923 start_codon:yes stop_codon:yes gene_type:complete